MTTPELFTATDAHARMLDAIQGKSEYAYVEYMNNLTEEVIGSGGVCDETTFLRSFYAAYQRPEFEYKGGMPGHLKPTMAFAKWLQNRVGKPIGKLEYDESVGAPRVLARPVGAIICTGIEDSPVISYYIEESENDGSMYSGSISFDALWTPSNNDKRRVEDISEEDIDEHDLLLIERDRTDSKVTVKTMHMNDVGMGIILGHTQIERVKATYQRMEIDSFNQGQKTLRAGAKILGIEIS